MDNELFELCKRVWEKTGWGEKNIKVISPVYHGIFVSKIKELSE